MDIIKSLKEVLKFGRIGRREQGGLPIDIPARNFSPRRGFVSAGSNSLALSIGTVYRCVRFISESVANLPMVYQVLNNGIYRPDVTSKLQYILSVQPNESYNAFDFWVQAIQYVLLKGNAYIVPRYNPVTMDIDRLVLCNPGAVSHDVINDKYVINDLENNLICTCSEEEVIHIKGLSLDGKHGLSVLSFARMTLDIAATGNAETLNRFANGGNVRGIVSNDTSVKGFGDYVDEELEKAAEDIDDKFQDGKRIVSLPGQVDFKQISLSSTDMQFLESRKFTVREICRFFGVHPSFVFDDTSNNYKDAEMSNLAFLSNTLNPLLRRIEVELLRKLVSPALYHTRRFKFDRKALFACDLDSLAKYQSQRLASGLSTINELREEEDKPAIPGGDILFVSANLKSVDEFKNNNN
jgi:HK97 family phage portal protein